MNLTSLPLVIKCQHIFFLSVRRKVNGARTQQLGVVPARAAAAALEEAGGVRPRHEDRLRCPWWREGERHHWRERREQEREEEENHLWVGALWSRHARLRFQPCCKLEKEEEKNGNNSTITQLFRPPGSHTIAVLLSYRQNSR